jgi:glycosyltransferase involved in cell wall biosynthesis
MSLLDETVAVVVVTYNSDRLLDDLLASFDDGLKGVAWHLIVADNASADGTLATLRRIAPTATIIEMGRQRCRKGSLAALSDSCAQSRRSALARLRRRVA